MEGNEIKIKNIEELKEELKRNLELKDSNTERILINNIEYKLNEELNYYTSENLEIKHKLVKVLENDKVIVSIIEITMKSNNIISERRKILYIIKSKFKTFVEKEYYKKVKQYEDKKYILEDTLNMKINSKEELKEFIRQHKDNKQLISQIYLNLRNDRELIKILNINDIKELDALFKEALQLS